jgi:hypothetical protein
LNFMKQLNDTDEIKRSTPYIGYLDLMGKGNVKVTIEDVFDIGGDKLDGGRKADPQTYAISFKGIPQRKLIVKGNKMKHLMRCFGKKKSGWVGKEIEIYGDPDESFGGVVTGGVKIVGQPIKRRTASEE